MIRPAAARAAALETPRAPAWARPGHRAPAGDGAALEAAFLAGAGLGALDAFLRLAPPWAGVWRRRLALQAAAASMRLIGRREDEAALRDAWALRRPGDDPGPAGRVLGAWRSLSERSDPLAPEKVAAAAAGFGAPPGAVLPAIVAVAQDLARGDWPAVLAAAEAARRVVALRPEAELLALWLAAIGQSGMQNLRGEQGRGETLHPPAQAGARLPAKTISRKTQPKGSRPV